MPSLHLKSCYCLGKECFIYLTPPGRELKYWCNVKFSALPLVCHNFTSAISSFPGNHNIPNELFCSPILQSFNQILRQKCMPSKKYTDSETLPRSI